MGRKLLSDRKMTAAERCQKLVMVGNDLTAKYAEAVEGINWERRNFAEQSALNWFATYAVGVIADYPPAGHLPEALGEMENALTKSRAYQIIMARGHGKTTLAEAVGAKAIATGARKYLVIIAANLDHAKSILADIFRIFTSEAFVQDYPHIGMPLLHATETSFKRAFTIDGTQLECNHTTSEIVLPTILGEDGEPLPSSGSIVKAFGFGAGIRGVKRGKLRPDIAILDDIQTDEDANNPETVLKNLEIIRKSVMNLGGRKKLAIINTATIIAPDDLACALKADKTWKTTQFPAFLKWPTDYETNKRGGLWAKYFDLFDRENLDNAPHDKSREFYASNRAEMDAGADVLDDTNFSAADGHVSAVQKLMDRLHEVGESAFACEMQMSPKVDSAGLVITPRDVAAASRECYERLSVPSGYSAVYASSDLNLSYAITTVVKAYARDGSKVVIYHETHPCKVDAKLSPAAYYNEVTEILVSYGRHLAELTEGAGITLDGWGIDCNGTPQAAVCDFCRRSVSACGIRAVGLRGSSSTRWNPLTKMRLADARGRVVLVGDAVENGRAGAGAKWLWFDSDYYRENVHLSILQADGLAGAERLYHAEGADGRARADYCVQVCNERLMFKRQTSAGLTEYKWKTREPHDYFDASAMCDAQAAYAGTIGLQSIRAESSASARGASVPRGTIRRRSSTCCL